MTSLSIFKLPTEVFKIASRHITSSLGQDRFFARVFDDVTIVAIANGVGGRAGSAEASQLVVQEAARIAQGVRDPRDADFWASWLSEVHLLLDADARA